MKQLNLVTSISIVLFCYFSGQAQLIKGKLITSKGQTVNSGYVTFKNKTQDSKVLEYTLINKASFAYRLKKSYQDLVIQIYTDSYQTHTEILNLSKSKEAYNLVIQLTEKSIENLDEVIIKGSNKFSVKKDTVSFNVSAYKNTEDRKVEDILKKLPGISVDSESGKISYRGRSIETVMLDGDNLFDKNYTIGTKNINAKMIDKIEAIENYNENEILGSLTRSENVALNLKLKKGKIDLSGSIEGALGTFNTSKVASGVSGTGLGVAKNYKYFSTLTFNNIGIDNMPRNLNGNKKAKTIVAERFSKANLNSDYTNINEQLFSSLNSIFKLNDYLDLKAKVYYLKDQLSSKQNITTNYNINGDSFTTTDQTNFQKKPDLIHTAFNLKYLKSQKSILEFDFDFTGSKTNNSINIIQNNNLNFDTNLNTNYNYLSPKLTYTKKISKTKALLISGNYSYSDAPQTISFDPLISFNDKRIASQFSEFSQQNLNLKGQLIAKFNNNNNYNISVGYDSSMPEYKSFQTNQNNIQTGFNNSNYKKQSTFISSRFKFNFKSLKVSPELKLSHIKQNLINETQQIELNSNDLSIQPKISFRYNFKNSFINLRSAYVEKAILDDYLFSNQVLVDQRTAINNLPSTELQKTKSINFIYFKNDLYNSLDLGIFGNYQVTKGRFFTNSSISENFIQTTYFYSPQINTSLNLGFNFSKYVDALATTIKLNSSYNLTEFNNIVNDSDFRSNKSEFFEQSLFFKTAFLGRLNFENQTTWQKSITKSENSMRFNNDRFENNLKLIYKPFNDWLLISSFEVFVPEIDDSSQNFNFLDINLNYRPDKNWSFSLMLRNLTNQNSFKQISTTDISTNVVTNNLLPRHFLLRFTWDF